MGVEAGGILLFGEQRAHLFVAEAFELFDELVVVAAGLLDFLEFDCLGQFRHHELTRVDHLEREVHSIDLADAGEQLHGEQGVAAEFEEIVVDADGFDVEEFGPEDGEIAFERGARGVDGALRSAAARGVRRAARICSGVRSSAAMRA